MSDRLTDFERAGQERFFTAFRQGDDIARLFDEMLQDALRGYGPPLTGALAGARGILNYCKREKLSFGGAAAGWGSTRIEHESARLLAMRDYKGFAEVLGILAAMLHAARRAVPGLKQMRVEEAAPPPPAASGPLKVEVVAMPARVSTSEVSRDESGAISTVQQIERDL